MHEADVWDTEVGVVIVGSGVAGMTTAIVCENEGLKPLILEKTEYFGGTAGRAVGAIWIVDSQNMRDAGFVDSAAKARRYFDLTVGDNADRKLQDAYIDKGAEALEYMLKYSDLAVEAINYPDYQPQLEGGMFGRFHAPLAFDGRLLGEHFKYLRPPLKIFTLFGGMMLDDFDMQQFLSMRRSIHAFFHAAKRTIRYLFDRVKYPRGTRLVLGNALIGRLYHTLVRRNIEMWRQAEVGSLISIDGRIHGVELIRDGRKIRVRATSGVVIATGGYAGNLTLRHENSSPPVDELTVGLETNIGDGIRMALACGAKLDKKSTDDAWYVPMSVLDDKAGQRKLWPHFVLDRAKPGVIAVGRNGHRFTNEAASYHDFVKGMKAAAVADAWLVCDNDCIARYGLGIIPPGFSLSRFQRAGYLVSANTIENLAIKLGIESFALNDEVIKNNQFWKTGLDLDFGKGLTAYNVFQGDARHKPSACLGPIEHAPFHAVHIVPGNFGTSRGLVTNAIGQVLDGTDAPIPGLFACGNDMNSAVGGQYIGAGITLGPAITFGYLIGRSITQNLN